MKKLILAALLNCGFAHAMNAADTNLFVSALKNGTSTAPIPNDRQFAPAIKSLQTMTGDSGPIVVEVYRITRFQQQARCGRVAFIIGQPSSKHAWPELGGQLNICEDGIPPWRVCKGQPHVLIAPDQPCADKSTPVDTPEVVQAIQDALASGSLSEDQIRKRVAADAAKQKKTTLPAGIKP